MVTPGTIDLVLGSVLLLGALAGYRSGVVRITGGIVGLVGGAWAGLAFAPGLVRSISSGLPPLAYPVLIMLVVVAAASFGQMLVGLSARRLLPVPKSAMSVVDRVLGAVVTGAITAGAVWAVTGLASMTEPSLGRAMDSSRIASALDAAAPVRHEDVARVVAGLAARSEVPALLAGDTSEPQPRVDPAVARRGGVTAAAQSVVRIDAAVMACGRMQEGSGFVVGRGLVVTNAHVVAGSSGVTVSRGKWRGTAEVVAFDPRRDVAVLSVDTGDMVPLRMVDDDLGRGDSAVVAGYPLGGPYTTQSTRVKQRMHAIDRVVDGSGGAPRVVYALAVAVKPGNSGGPLLTPDGKVAGVVFARSDDDAKTAYALTLREVRPALDQARVGRRVGVGDCRAA